MKKILYFKDLNLKHIINGEKVLSLSPNFIGLLCLLPLYLFPNWTAFPTFFIVFLSRR